MTHILITTDTVGGVWSYSLALAAGFATAGIQSTLAVLGPPPDANQIAEAKSIEDCTLSITHLGLDWTARGKDDLDQITAGLITAARHAEATSVHLHAPCLAAGAWSLPVVAVAHSCMATWWASMRGGPMPSEILWHAQATQAGLQAANRIVAPSAAFGQQLRQSYSLNRTIDIIHNGIANPAVPPSPRDDYVLAAGRLWDESKNISLLDGAAKLMHAPVHAAGPLAAPFAQDITASNLLLTGKLSPPALRAAMSRAAVFASPARYEPFGLAVLEAAQTATPLVLSDIPVFRELWDGAAMFVPPNDAQAWATTLDNLIADKHRRAQLGEAARARASRYTQDTMVAATARIHATLPVPDLQPA